jgi:hypothetical protein
MCLSSQVRRPAVETFGNIIQGFDTSPTTATSTTVAAIFVAVGVVVVVAGGRGFQQGFGSGVTGGAHHDAHGQIHIVPELFRVGEFPCHGSDGRGTGHRQSLYVLWRLALKENETGTTRPSMVALLVCWFAMVIPPSSRPTDDMTRKRARIRRNVEI